MGSEGFTPVNIFACDFLVREEAVLLIGNMDNVSEEMLEQTLDKKLMSNMRAKKSAHEREASLVSAGEWSSGETPLEDVPALKHFVVVARES